jgi:hypothetical protein
MPAMTRAQNSNRWEFSAMSVARFCWQIVRALAGIEKFVKVAAGQDDDAV